MEVHMYPNEFLVFDRNSESCSKMSNIEFSQSISDVLKNNSLMFPPAEYNYPFGIAAYGPSLKPLNETQNRLFSNTSIFRNLYPAYWLTVAFFCPKNKATYWFNYWSRYRYRWWRKLSSIPSHFSMSDVTETSSGGQETSLILEFPWGKEKVETIVLCDNSHQKENNSCDTSTIFCDAELNLATFAYISNSLSQKLKDNKTKNLFQFTAKLAPYKVCLLPDTRDSNSLRNVFEVSKHLEKDLKAFGIEVYPCIELSSLLSPPEQLKKFDEMGVPYTIIISDKALSTGIVGLRNRDTTLEEEVHIAEITQKLLKYLSLQISTF